MSIFPAKSVYLHLNKCKTKEKQTEPLTRSKGTINFKIERQKKNLPKRERNDRNIKNRIDNDSACIRRRLWGHFFSYVAEREYTYVYSKGKKRR